MEILVWESFEPAAAAIRWHPGPAHSYNMGMTSNLIYHPHTNPQTLLLLAQMWRLDLHLNAFILCLCRVETVSRESCCQTKGFHFGCSSCKPLMHPQLLSQMKCRWILKSGRTKVASRWHLGGNLVAKAQRWRISFCWVVPLRAQTFLLKCTFHSFQLTASPSLLQQLHELSTIFSSCCWFCCCSFSIL